MLDIEIAKIGWKQSERWITQQILREMAGEPKMPDSDEDIWEMVSLILPLQGPRQSWEVIAGKFHKSS